MRPIIPAVAITMASFASEAVAQPAIFEDGAVVNLALCVGDDCPETLIFGFDTMVLRENNLRILFDDSSEPGSGFPNNDWRLTANGSGATDDEFFRIEDASADTSPFRIDAGAPTHALRIAPDGHIGVGTPMPLQSVHVVGTDTPTIRLEQSAGGGNPAQRWDIGANNENVFLRDQDANTLPFRIRPGAPTNSIYVDTNGQVGMGLQNPIGALHVRRNQPNNRPHLVLQNRREGGRTELWFQDRDTATDDDTLRLQLRGDDFNITFNGTGGSELQVSKTGDVRIFRGDLVIPNGGVIVGGTTLNVPDYVFADDYDLMPLGDLEAFVATHSHLPGVPSAAEIVENGLDIPGMVLAILKSHEELTLHTLAQEDVLLAQAREIGAQNDRIAVLEALVAALSADRTAHESR